MPPRVAAISALLLFAACAPSDARRSQKPSRETSAPIVGGRGYRGVPAVGALTYDGSPECTGTLISSRRVLTAAHCLEDSDVSTMGFVTGASAYEPVSGAGVAAAIMHPDYDTDTLDNDIGWVLLARPLAARPLRVVEEIDESWIGEDLLFVGYGTTSSEGEGIGIKRAVTMPLDDLYGIELVYGDDETNVCDGDSGGPALHKSSSGEYLVAGVTSSGDADCSEFGVSTRADVYRDFLEVDDRCGGETFFGRCNGRTLVYCDGDSVQEVDCDDACGLDGAKGFDCLARASDPCEGETLFGRCAGDTLIWCDGDGVVEDDCDRCGLEGPDGFNCI